MSNPNIATLTTAYGKAKTVALTTTPQDVLENTAASGKLFRVRLLRVTNVDAVNAAEASVSFVDATGPATGRLANSLPVPAQGAVDLIERGQALYLEEGDKVTGFASNNGDIELVLSWEEVS